MTPTFRSPQEHDHSNADWDAAIDDAREEKAQLRAHTTRRSSSKYPRLRTAPLAKSRAVLALPGTSA